MLDIPEGIGTRKSEAQTFGSGIVSLAAPMSGRDGEKGD
jgi:hypothetical protein